jgi:hypothetical protein
VAAFPAAPWLAALLSGLGGFMTALLVQSGVLLLRLAAVSCQPGPDPFPVRCGTQPWCRTDPSSTRTDF